MKPFALALPLLFFFTLAACDEEQDPDSPSEQVTNTLTAHDWKVTYFLDANVNETANFSGWVFAFQPEGVVTAKKGTTTKVGIWTTIDYADEYLCNVVIGFDPGDFFGDLGADWSVLELASGKVRLKYEKSVGVFNYLTFETN